MMDIVEFLAVGSERELIEKTLENELHEIENRKYDIILKAMEIVEEYNFDPWNIDISKFADIFMKEINENFKDFPVAGKIIYLAWLNLKNKSEMLVPREEEQPQDFSLMDDGIMDLSTPTETEEDITFSFMPTDKRNISIHDLIDAIKNVRLLPRRKEKKDEAHIPFNETSHPEDLHLIIRNIWNRILEVDNETFPMETIFGEEIEDRLDVFVSSLYLSFYNRVLLTQDIPYGTIWITVIDRNNSESPLPEMKLDEPFAI